MCADGFLDRGYGAYGGTRGDMEWVYHPLRAQATGYISSVLGVSVFIPSRTLTAAMQMGEPHSCRVMENSTE